MRSPLPRDRSLHPHCCCSNTAASPQEAYHQALSCRHTEINVKDTQKTYNHRAKNIKKHRFLVKQTAQTASIIQNTKRDSKYKVIKGNTSHSSIS